MVDETHTQTSETTETTAVETDATALNGGAVDAATIETTDATTALNASDTGKVAEEGKTEEAGKEAVAIPEAYELTAPEGTTLDPAMIEAATPIFKELGLTNEAANKLMPLAMQFAQNTIDKGNAQILAQVQADRKAWLDTAQADPEIGGQKWGDTIATAAKALDALGLVKGSPFRVLLDESGLGNHPEMIRAFQKVGKAIGEDGFERGEGSVSAKRDRLEILYAEDVKGANK